MAVTLAESAKLSTNQLRAGVIETIVQEFNPLSELRFEDVQGNAYAYNTEGTLPGVAFRGVNQGYAESTGTVNDRTESLTMFGGDADVDRFIEVTRGNLVGQRATQTALKSKALALGFADAFINGDKSANANAFDGLKTRLTGAQVISAGTNGLAIVGADDAARHTFLDKLDELLAAVPGGADALIMNSGVKAKIKSAARRIGGWDSTRAEFGMTIDTYNGVRLYDAGVNPAGVPIIPQTEVQGTATNASSIYAVKWAGGENDTGVLGLWSPGGVMVDDLGMLQEKPVYRTRIELYSSIAVFGRGAARLTGVLNA
jgi:hypothetical protein